MRCRHLIWDADALPDHDGMVIEHCRACGATRKTIGTWWALKSGGHISANAMFSGSSLFDVNNPPSFRINNVDAILSEPQELIKEDDTVAKRERRPHGFWKENWEAVKRDIQQLGPEASRRKWRIPGTTWKLYLPQWLGQPAAVAATSPAEAPKRPAVASVPAITVSSACLGPCAEILALRSEVATLRAYNQAVHDVAVMLGIRIQGVTTSGNDKKQG